MSPAESSQSRKGAGTPTGSRSGSSQRRGAQSSRGGDMRGRGQGARQGDGRRRDEGRDGRRDEHRGERRDNRREDRGGHRRDDQGRQRPQQRDTRGRRSRDESRRQRDAARGTQRDEQRAQRDVRVDLPRLVAYRALRAVREDDAYANLILPDLLRDAGLSGRDAAFATALTYGTLRMQGRYDVIIEHCAQRALHSIDGAMVDVLRLGAHQLLNMRVPSHAAVSATVDLASDVKGRGAAGFANAVLRAISQRDDAEWGQWLLELGGTQADQDARVYSHPRWIVAALKQALIRHGGSAEELAELLEADNSHPYVTLCARPGLISREELSDEISALSPDDSRTHAGQLTPTALILHHGDPADIPSVVSAQAAVEDEGSQLTALVAASAPLEGRDERWLDMCAGPGGKAALLGSVAAQRGATLVANEITPHRADLVRSSVSAIPAGTVEVRCGDGRDFGAAEPGQYDRVLLDAPCSGLGSLRRRPESRWRRHPSDVGELTEIQRDLLRSALTTVRVGGVVAYVTCSPHVAETSLVVKDVVRALERDGHQVTRLDASAVAASLGEYTPRPHDGQDTHGDLQLWPHRDGTDAMFCALLRRDS